MHPTQVRFLRIAPAIAILVLAACSTPGGSPAPTPGPSVIPGPTSGTTYSAGELKLLLIDRLGPRWFCDPDEYPVSQGTEQERAIERFAEMKAEGDIYRAVAARRSIDPDAALSDAQKLAIYHEWKVAFSIELAPIGDGRYRFDYLAQPVGGAAEGKRTAGIIDDAGEIAIEQEVPAGEPMCPICLARGTAIDGPDGSTPVERLRLGDRVWTLDEGGQRIVGTVLALGSATAPRDHTVIRLTLEDGRSVTASPGHPLGDGRRLGDLRVGDAVDGSRVATLAHEAYGFGATFDLLVSGSTGIYLVDGIPMGSTLG